MLHGVGFGSFVKSKTEKPKIAEVPITFQGQSTHKPGLHLGKDTLEKIKMTGPGTGDQGLE